MLGRAVDAQFSLAKMDNGMQAAVGMSLCFLAVLLGASFVPAWGNWGGNSLSALPIWGRLLLVAAGAAGAVLAQRPAAARVSAWPFQNKRLPVAIGLLCAAGIAIFWVLRSHTYVGDAYLTVGRTGHGAVYNTNALSNYYLHAVCAIVRFAGGDALDAVRWGASLMGAVFIAAATAAGKLVGRTRVRQGAVFVLLCTIGVLHIFFGRVEIYAPLATWTLVYLCIGIAALKGKLRWEAAAVALGVGVGLHVMMAPLALSLAYVVIAIHWEKPSKWTVVLRLLKAGMLALAPVALTCVLIFFHVYHGSWRDVREDTKRLGSLSDPSELFTHVAAQEGGYTLLSVRHVADVANEAVLTCPGALMGLAFYLVQRRRRGARTSRERGRIAWFLVLAVVPLALYTATAYADDFRGDWDAFSIFGVPLTLLAAHLLAGLPSSAGSSAARCFAAAGAVSLLAWAIENARVDPASENHMRQHVALIQLNRGDYSRCAKSAKRLHELARDESDRELLLAMGEVLAVRELEAVRAQRPDGVRYEPRMRALARVAYARLERVSRNRRPSESAEILRTMQSLHRIMAR